MIERTWYAELDLAPRSVAPALCVREAVVRQLRHDAAQAVMTAVGKCYVSVPFQE